MSERRLSTVLIKRFSRVAWTALGGYALLVVVAFAVAAEVVLRRSLEHSADAIQSLLGTYTDSTGGPGGVMPTTLADQLLGMGAQVAITRTTRNAGGMQQVYFLSPGMPAQRLEGLPASASPDDVRQVLLTAIAQRARWRYRTLHRSAGPFDIYIVGSRQPYLVALAGLTVVAALLLPLVALSARSGARRAVADALGPLGLVTAATSAIGPADLGRRIASPTGQAEITELAESINRMLERVDRAHRALESFTADASHELRTPLTHLRAQVQWALGDGRAAADVGEALVAMERELERTTKMVDELLLIARGENQQLALARAPFDLTALVAEVKEIAEAMATGRDLAVQIAVSGPVWAWGDADRTRHVLLNLASNAVRSNGTMAGVSVEDTGPGIAPEHIERIFHRFYRIDQSRSRAFGGAGLGLAIARLLAELQGGAIAVESSPGRGSTFTLWLARADVAAAADSPVPRGP